MGWLSQLDPQVQDQPEQHSEIPISKMKDDPKVS
jgi:hypothetical protein